MPTPLYLSGSARQGLFGEYHMRTFVSRFARSESGSNALEYGLIVGLISLAIVAGATTAGTGMNTLFTTVATAITTAVAAF
jgi:pilus assembly protein Flp/PilA